MRQFPCDIQDGGDDSFIGPACRKLGLAGLADSVSVTAPRLIAVEYVRSPLDADADVLRVRPVLGVDRIPPGTMRIGRPKRLVVLLVAPRLNGLGPHRGNVAIRPASRHLPLRPGEIVVRPV
jgi:hypothetical protein